MVLVHADVYVNHMENNLKDNIKFEKLDIKTGTLNFQVNYEKRINGILKNLKSVGSSSVKQYKKLKQLDLYLLFYMVFVKFTKQLLMFARLLGLYCLQLEHPLIKLLGF